MVLNGENIKDAIKTGEITIFRSIWENDKPKPQKIEAKDLNDSHKITLHVGYLLRTLSDNKWLDKKWLYYKKDGIVDLMKLEEHKYVLSPGESVLVFTNEFMEFKENYFGLVLPKVTGEESGVTISTTYVDPQWKGVLQLVVTNLSEKEHFLPQFSDIANLFIFKMSGPVTEAHVERNAHYNIPWEKIYTNDLRFWEARERNPFCKLIHIFHTRLKIIIGVGAIALLGVMYYIASILYSISSMIGK